MDSDADNRLAQEEELSALKAIYGDDFVDTTEPHCCTMCLPQPGAQPHLVLRAFLPEAYPAEQPPVVELACDCLSEDVLAELAQQLEGMYTPGNVVLFEWIEHVKEQWDRIAPQGGEGSGAEVAAAALAAAGLSDEEQKQQQPLEKQQQQQQQQQQQRRSAAARREPDEALQAAMAEVVESVVHGEPLTEKRSTFQAHLCPATSLQHVEALMELLLQNGKIRAASHNIMAYRISQPGGSSFLQDYDDDGESAAGGRLLHLLQMVDARDVAVVVSRWFGGILLGPARFTHINNAARQLLDACGYIASAKGSSSGGGGAEGGKKGKGGGAGRRK